MSRLDDISVLELKVLNDISVLELKTLIVFRPYHYFKNVLYISMGQVHSKHNTGSEVW